MFVNLTYFTNLLLFQDVAHVGLASILLRESQLDDTAVVIKKALEVRNSLKKCPYYGLMPSSHRYFVLSLYDWPQAKKNLSLRDSK